MNDCIFTVEEFNLFIKGFIERLRELHYTPEDIGTLTATIGYIITGKVNE